MPKTTKQAQGYPKANLLLHSSHPPDEDHPAINIEPVTPATEVKKHPTSPTKMMVLREGIFKAVVMGEFIF
jgi:hypothetical protein